MKVSQVAALTDIGRRKRDNEDAIVELSEPALFGVADGTGGVEAARVALTHLETRAPTLIRHARALLDAPDTSSRLGVARFFEDTLEEMSAEVRRASAARGTRMATTVVAATVIGRFAYIAHVGDSRAYLLRAGALRRLTSDHTLAMRQLRKGEISPREFAKSPYRKTLTQALGATPHLNPDIAEVLLAPGDLFLLCSDGLHRMLPDREIARVLSSATDLERAASALVAAANEAGGRDNTSVILFRVEADGAQTASASREFIDIAEALERVFLFRQLSEAERLLVAPYFEHRSFGSGEALCREGEPGESFFVIASGRAEITHGEAKLLELGPGGYAGEIALARRGPRTATITALEPSEVLTLSRERFLEIIRRRPALGAKLMMPLLRNVGDRVIDLRSRLRAVKEVMSGAGEAEAPL